MPTSYNTHTLTGFTFTETENVNGEGTQLTSAGPSTLTVSTTGDSVITYAVLEEAGDGLPEVELTNTVGATILGNANGMSLSTGYSTFLGNIHWNGNTTTLLIFSFGDESDDTTYFEHAFAIDGTPFPTINSVADFLNFDDLVTGFSQVQTGQFAPGAEFSGSDFLNVTTVNTSTLSGTSDADYFYGGAEDDVFYGNAGADTFYGDDGDDTVYSGSGNDFVALGEGNDYVKAGGGVEEFHGGFGKDYISYYDSSSGVTVNLDTNVISGSWASNDTISGFESVSGSKTGDDKIYGTSGSNTIKTYGGKDKVYAGKGADKVELGSGNDYVKAGGGVEEFHGGSGKDYISYYDSSNGVTVNLDTNVISGSWASNDTISGFESAAGSKTGDDKIYGTSGSNTIKTYGGDDKVYAGKGTDKVELGAGDDYTKVGGGKKNFDGGSGKDYISYYDSTGGIMIDLAADAVSGSWAVNDTIKDFESASGSKTGADKMFGTSGSNTLKSYGGDDKLYGRSGDDKMYGGNGEDRFDGGHGDDTLYGGDDADIFHFDHGEDHDTIKDFENNVDTIQLDNFSFAAGQDAFDFATQVGSDVVFDFGGGDMLTVEDATIVQLHNDLEMV